MKILFSPAHYIYDEYVFGSEPYVTFNIVDRITKKNKGSVVITGKKLLKNRKEYRVIEVQKNKPEFNMSLFRAIFFTVLYTIAGVKLLRKEKFDIIHHVRPFALGSTFNLIPLLGLNKNTPFVIGPFCSTYKSEKESSGVVKKIVYRIIKPIISFLSIATLRRVNKVIVYDENTKNQVAKYINCSKIEVIPPGKDKEIYNHDVNRQFSDPFEFVYVGNLIARKGVDSLIKAFSLVVKDYPTTTLKIVGNGIERKNLEMLVAKLNLKSNVIFLGFIENKNIHSVYKNAHVFVSMQREESFGQVFVEAMACGVPIITTETVGSRTIIGNNAFGIIVPQGDIEGFAKKMILLTKSKDLVKKMSGDARHFFENNYDWDDVIIPKYLKVYKEVLNNRK